MANFAFREQFSCACENNLPRSISVEKNSFYTHNHIRWEDETCYICCEGNKFFCVTPPLAQTDAALRIRFHNTFGRHGCALYFRYDRMLRQGLSVELTEVNDGCRLYLCRIDREERHVLDRIDLKADSLPDEICLAAALDGECVRASVNGEEYCFGGTKGLLCEAGEVGFAFLGSVGEMALIGIDIESGDSIPCETLTDETTASIPLRNGSNIPYTLTWSVVRKGGVPYLLYRLAGGPQDRPLDPAYPRETGQYTVEQARITRPYIALYDKAGQRISRNTIFPGRLTVTDPGLHWKELLTEYFRITDLPLEGEYALPANADISRIAYGYELYCADGYRMQMEEDVEFGFDLKTGALLHEGKAPDTECILVSSPADKAAVRIIPDEIVDADQVRRRMAANHYFTEEEAIRFSASVQTKKPAAFLSLTAGLQDVYGDPIGSMEITRTDGGWQLAHAPMSVGVYRIVFTALFGDKPLCTREIVFEVFDPTGMRCAPLESGLPFLYSTPNEQRYLDRDAFDPWNPFPDCSMEHFYACSCFAGDVAMKKRIWEVIRLFGRKWYVWDSDHRTLTKEEFRDLHKEILRHADYCYYPLKYEWAVMRHDFVDVSSYRYGLMTYLHDFLALHPEYNPGIAPDADCLTKEQHRALMFTCYQEWMAYANERILADAEKDNQWMKSVNPGVKRACYGPFPIYAYPPTTYSGMSYIGFPTDERLSSAIFDGFAQLEDYPYSCCYNTYKGPFLLSHVLLHAPDVHVYPEQYTASEGGCIDGAVKDANPPLGKYDMPGYFNVTHAYEFVYNTAHLTKNGFEFWKHRGFMQRDFMPDFIDAFIRGWKHVLRHEPVSPLRSTAYLSEIPAFENFIKHDGPALTSVNRSNAGMSYVYETARTSGLPNGFAFRWDTLAQLTPEMTDCIVLPSLIDAPEGAIDAIRRLYEQGVSLIAVGRVDGLEDLFGVRYAPVKADICRICAPDGRSELIFPDQAEFLYAAAGAEVLMNAETPENALCPVLLKKGRTLLLNAPAYELNHQTFPKHTGLSVGYQACLSTLLREAMKRELHLLSNPTAVSDSCGVTLFRDANGNTMLLAIDYSPYEHGGTRREYQSTILLNDVSAAEAVSVYGPAPSVLRDESGNIRGLWLTLRQQECALIRLA